MVLPYFFYAYLTPLVKAPRLFPRDPPSLRFPTGTEAEAGADRVRSSSEAALLTARSRLFLGCEDWLGRALRRISGRLVAVPLPAITF